MRKITKKLFTILSLCFFSLTIFPTNSMANTDNNNSLKVELIPAWNGFYHPGKITEFAIRIFSKYGGMVNIKHQQFNRSFFLPAETPYLTSFPTLLKKGELVNFELTREDSKTSISKKTHLTPTLKPIIAVIDSKGSIPLGLLAILKNLNIILLPSSTSSLPQFNKAYQTIDAALISYSSFKLLEKPQLKAFSHYIAECGKVVIFNFPKNIKDRLSTIAGCKNSFFITSNISNQLTIKRIRHLLKITPTALPKATRLNDLSLAYKHADSALLFFSFCYFAIIFCLILFNVKKSAFLIIPILASVIAISFWHKEPRQNIASWLEMSDMQSSARYTSLLHIHGQGLWDGSIILPTAAYANILPTTSFDDNTPASMKIDLSTRLLSNHVWQWQSSQFIQPPLKLDIVNENPRIFNQSNKIIYNGLLSWGSAIYSLPPIPPNKHWSFTPSLPSKLNTKLVKLFKQQSQLYNLAALIPYASTLFQHLHNNEGWLLIHNDLPQSSL